MPGVFRYPLPHLLREIEEAASLGVHAFNIFCFIPDNKKDAIGSEAYNANGLFPRAIKTIKKEFPELLLMIDIALDPFTDHGFDGLVNDQGYVVNDPTVIALSRMALLAAESGVDLISPSDMMDGRVAFLRSCLDKEGFSDVGILSYAVKFASSLYAPFREALQSSPKTGDKKTYQLNPANSREALLECLLDDQEAADMLMIKPALFSLDIISKVRAQTLLPLGAYQVSGEYSMIKAAAQNQWLNEGEVFLESLLAIRRAGADFILTYAAKEVAKILQERGAAHFTV
jgi:porphobilinogen synthase